MIKILSIIAFSCFLTMGFFSLANRKENKQTLRLTPWPEAVSWLMWIALLASSFTNILWAFGK